MNCKGRRAAAKRGRVLAFAAPKSGETLSVDDLMAEARQHHQQGHYVQAEAVCRKILAREPGHVHSLNLIGIIAQASGRHRVAIKVLAEALASDPLDAACHYNIASSYQALGRSEDAADHFKKAIGLGLNYRSIEQFILHNPFIVSCLDRQKRKWPLPLQHEELFGTDSFNSVTNDIFLRCAMESVYIRHQALELFLTQLRSTLLHFATSSSLEPQPADDALDFFRALAQQCFINEYVFAQTDEEARQAGRLRDFLLEKIAAGNEISPLLLIAVAAYFPLYSLPGAETLLGRDWPATVGLLLRQQLREPLEELRDRRAIPVLTRIEDRVSLQVMKQYEENPYPRWTINPLVAVAAVTVVGERQVIDDILIAGCGTGQHALETAITFPEARVLAIDVSLPSLAYARRKSREEGIQNIEYAQADILKLGTISRRFNRIEAVGVLHHLADPKGGWRSLLSLLRPNGVMRVGLYSETARRTIAEARALIAERGYRATVEDIRTFRQEIFRGDIDGRWKMLTSSADFYCTSGCRDLLFHVMEHRFTIPEIIAFLDEQGLSFLGFEEPRAIEAFQRHNPSADALNDLNRWHAFEIANPLTFWSMYTFLVRKKMER